MDREKIFNFYKRAIDEEKFSADFVLQLKSLSSVEDLKKFIEAKVCPIAESMGYDFTLDELLSYEIEVAKKLSEEELENITGGVSLKHFVLGGVMSLMALGGEALLSSTAHAELSSKEVAGAYGYMMRNLENSDQSAPSQESTQPKAEDKSADDTQSESDKSDVVVTNNSAATAAADTASKEELEKINQKIAAEEKKKAAEMAVTGAKRADTDKASADGSSALATTAAVQTKSDQAVERKASTQIDDLKAVQKADVPQVESSKFTDEQKLYVMEALNLQDAYALLQSGVIENLRFSGNISTITFDDVGRRKYVLDKGDAFTDLLYMLYPSSAGVLNVNGASKERENFSMFGGISKELMAKFCSFLNDYRNGQIELPGQIATRAMNERSMLDDEFKKNVIWLVKNGFNATEGNDFSNAVESCRKGITTALNKLEESQKNRLALVQSLDNLTKRDKLSEEEVKQLVVNLREYNGSPHFINQCFSKAGVEIANSREEWSEETFKALQEEKKKIVLDGLMAQARECLSKEKRL